MVNVVREFQTSVHAGTNIKVQVGRGKRQPIFSNGFIFRGDECVAVIWKNMDWRNKKKERLVLSKQQKKFWFCKDQQLGFKWVSALDVI